MRPWIFISIALLGLPIRRRTTSSSRCTTGATSRTSTAWRELGHGVGRFSVRAPVDQGQLFVPFFEYAAKLVDGNYLK